MYHGIDSFDGNGDTMMIIMMIDNRTILKNVLFFKKEQTNRCSIMRSCDSCIWMDWHIIFISSYLHNHPFQQQQEKLPLQQRGELKGYLLSSCFKKFRDKYSDGWWWWWWMDVKLGYRNLFLESFLWIKYTIFSTVIYVPRRVQE